MAFFGNIAKFFGLISVKERQNTVYVSGIDGLIMAAWISKIWETDKINKAIFKSITSTGFSFNSFYIPDIHYILERLKLDPRCTWSARSSIDKVILGFQTDTWYKSSIAEIPSMIDLKRIRMLKWKPLDHQMRLLHAYGDLMPRYSLRGYIVGYLPGQGKTLSSLFVACAVIPPSIAEVKIIISPKKAVHLVWEKTIRSAFKKVPTFWCADEGTQMPDGKCEYYIFNYEKLDKAIELAKALKGRNVRYFIVVDESHNFADFKSGRTQDLVKLQTIRDDTYFVWLSGTPIVKHAAELVSYLKCADARFDQDAELTFKRIYTNSPGRANEIINHRLGKMMVATATKVAPTPYRTVVKELPVKIPKQISDKYLMSSVREEMKAFIVERLQFYDKEMVSMRNIINTWFSYHEHRLIMKHDRTRFITYVKMVKILARNPDRLMTTELSFCRNYERKYLLPSIPARERKNLRNALSAVKTLKLKVRGEALGKILAKRRSECTAALTYYCKPADIIKNSLSKTLFFSSAVLPIKVLVAHLEKEGFKPLMVYGPNNANLTKMMNAFEKDPMANPVCATMKSLSEAVPVTSASTVVLLDRPFRQNTWDQLVARSDRLGQQFPVTVIETVLDTGTEPNVSTSNDVILGDVRDLINEIMGKDYAGPDPSEREYHMAVDASTEDPNVLSLDDYMGV